MRGRCCRVLRECSERRISNFMRINGKAYRTIWVAADGEAVEIIDQTLLPHQFAIVRLKSLADVAAAIRTMQVRGAPLIGAAAAYGICLAMHVNASDEALDRAYEGLLATRPTAVNLRWALDVMREHLRNRPRAERVAAAYQRAAEICDEDVATNKAIGEHGAALLADIAGKKNGPFNVLTHCNAGWLATVDWGTALAPIYKAHEAGMPLHVWVDETRPRNQGMSLTAWELGQMGVRHTVIADNVGGHLMQHGMVDAVIVGSDRTTAHGDVCNKIGTYLKALAAKDNGVPFYVGLPLSTIDWEIEDGVKQIPIEERSGAELSRIKGRAADGAIVEVDIAPDGSAMANYAFDVTPAHLVTGLITERGLCAASAAGLRGLFGNGALKHA
jgi:methylthioribose-1-phosphate isomerase